MKRARTHLDTDLELENPWKKKKTQGPNYCNEHESNPTSHLCGNCKSVMTASRANHVHCLHELLNQCKSDDSSHSARNALFYAIGQGYVNCVRILLDFDDSEVNTIQQSGIAPLHLSAGAGHTEIMRELLKRGADVHLCLETDQLTSLHICASFGALDCLTLLLENGADPLQQTSDSSMNALHFAAYHGNIECMKVLLEKGYDINTISKKSHRTVLHYAMCQGKFDCFEFLVQNGADVNLLDINGHSSLLCAPLTEETLRIDATKYFSLAERRKWLSFATMNVEQKPRTFKISRNHSLTSFKEIFLEISTLVNTSALFERIPVIEFCFEDEIGKGLGVMREFFTQLGEELVKSPIIDSSENPKYHQFSRCSSSMNHDERLLHASFMGMIFALALICGHVVPINLPPYVHKLLIGKETTVPDMEAIDSDYYHQIISLRNYSKSEIEETDLHFTTCEFVQGKLTEVELIEHGAEQRLYHSNVEEYLHALCKHKLFWGRSDVINEFVRSFHRVIPQSLLVPLFTENDLVSLLTGDQTISITDWKRNTLYKNCNETHNEIQWFWELLNEFTDQKKATLLAFCTGTKYLPIGGFERLQQDNAPFTIQFHDQLVKGTLPTARTCFNTLILPPCDTKESMKNRLEYVLDQQDVGVGFAFV